MFKYNQRIINSILPTLEKIKKLSYNFKDLSDVELKKIILESKEKYYADPDNGGIFIQFMSLIDEVIRRKLNKKPYDVQILGGILLCKNRIIEMSTGEGKTLVSAFPVVWRGLAKKGVHVVTANDYLVRRDHDQMRTVYEFFGMSSNFIISSTSKEERKVAYQCDIVYSSSSELGFDFLKDSIALVAEDRVQRNFYFALVDEADSNLLDEANTPLIITESSEDFGSFSFFNNLIVKLIKKEDVEVKPKEKFVTLLDSGYTKIEDYLLEKSFIKQREDLYAPNTKHMLYLYCCLQAHYIYFKDKDYLVYNGEILIISEKTGRAMQGRRWSGGIHQAIEAKEGIEVRGDSTTKATITLQNLFKLYPYLSGMTGTAATDSNEFNKVYGLDTIVVPTNKPCIRRYHEDLIYLSEKAKINAIIKKITHCREKKQPVLVGTTTVESSEKISSLCKMKGIPHQLLNAKQTSEEALIISQAGSPGAITIATNMAGRGTDIILGGNPDTLLMFAPDSKKDKIIRNWLKDRETVIQAGGLFVIASEKHNLRRIDNQLIGRCARQGEPGECQFYISLEDQLIRNFIDISKFNLQDLTDNPDDAVRIPLITLSSLIARAQKMLESRSFEARDDMMKNDNIINSYRNMYCKIHDDLLDTSYDIERYIDQMFDDLLMSCSDEEDFSNLCRILCISPEIAGENLINSSLSEKLKKCREIHAERMQQLKSRDLANERIILVQVLIQEWQAFITYAPHAQLNANLMSHAQQDPVTVFRKTINWAFVQVMMNYRNNSIKNLIHFWQDTMKVYLS